MEKWAINSAAFCVLVPKVFKSYPKVRGYISSSTQTLRLKKIIYRSIVLSGPYMPDNNANLMVKGDILLDHNHKSLMILCICFYTGREGGDICCLLHWSP